MIIGKRFSGWLIFAPAVLAPIILLGPALAQGHVLYWGTPGLQFIPWREIAWEYLRSGIAPLWNPLNGMGAPLLANYQLAIFYPPGWVLFLFSAAGGTPWLAWGFTLLVILHLIWAGIGMSCFMRLILGNELSPMVCGLAFSVGGYLTARAGFFSIIWTASWLPWIIWAAGRLILNDCGDRKRSWILTLELTIPIVFMLLAGHAQLSWYILLLGGFWVAFLGWNRGGVKRGAGALVKFAFSCFLAAMITSAQLLPTLEYLMQSQRAGAVNYEQALSYSFWPWHFISLIAPDFFGNPGRGDYWGYGNYWEDAVSIGVLPLLMALSTVPFIIKKQENSQRPRQGLVRFFWGVVVVAFLLALGKFTPIFPFLYDHIPTFNMFKAPSRILILAVFSLSVLAGIGIEKWKTPQGKGLYWLRLATAGGAAVTMGAFLAMYYLESVELTFIRATALAGIWALGTGLLTLYKPDPTKIKYSLIWQSLVVILTASDLILNTWRLNPTVSMFYFKKDISEVKTIQTLTAGQRILIKSEDEDLIKYKRFLRFNDFRYIESPNNIRFVLLPNLNLIDGIASANNFDPLVPARYAEWMAVVDKLSDADLDQWLRLMGVSVLESYRSDEPMGVQFTQVEGAQRVFWATCAEFAGDPTSAFDLLKQKVGYDDKLVVIEASGKGIADESCNGGDVRWEWVNDRPNDLEINYLSTNDGWLVISDVWYPGWKAWIDQQDTQIYRANYLFRAVRAPAGKHTLVLKYKPGSLLAGGTLSLLGIMIWGVAFRALAKRDKH